MPSHDIHKAAFRNSASAKPRREPYWGAPIAPGKHLGFRKASKGQGSWVARLRDDEGTQRYKALGPITKLSHGDAVKAAQAWFDEVEAGVVEVGPDRSKPKTVTDACAHYLDWQRGRGKESAAVDAERRFKQLVYAHPIADIALAKLTTKDVEDWRADIPGGPANKNRHTTSLKAALNRAVMAKLVARARAAEWRDVARLPGSNNRREVFLDIDQRRALLAACSGAFRDLVEAAILTGARPGELVSATVGAFDARIGSIRFDGKTGARTVPLSPAAVDLFKRCVGDQQSSDLLLTRDDGLRWQRGGIYGWVKAFRDAAEKAGLPREAVLYSLRHSFITSALMARMPGLEVAKITGTSIQMLDDHYGHLLAESARDRLAMVEMV